MTERVQDLMPRIAGGLFGLALALALALGAAGCLQPAPIFEAQRGIGGRALVLRPEFRLPDSDVGEQREALVDMVLLELRQSLTANGVSVDTSPDTEGQVGLRKALLASWSKARTRGGGRWRAGEETGLSADLAPLADRGVSAVMLVVLTRGGVGGRDDRLPLPSDYLAPLPDDKQTYNVPTAPSSAASGMYLDLLAVDPATGRVLASRRVEDRAGGRRDVAAAIPVLVREAARGLSSAVPSR